MKPDFSLAAPQKTIFMMIHIINVMIKIIITIIKIMSDNETCFLFGCNTESPRALRRPKAIKPNHQNVDIDISDLYQTIIGHNKILLVLIN